MGNNFQLQFENEVQTKIAELNHLIKKKLKKIFFHHLLKERKI